MANEQINQESKNFRFKNPMSNVVTSFIYYNSLIRDTMEYCIKKDNYDLKVYEYRKNGIINEPKIDSALHNFLVNNGENGQKFLDKLNDFADLVYGDDSTILHVAEADKTVRVDHAQHVTILENVITIHEELGSIIKLHINHMQKENTLEKELLNLIGLDEAYYRGIAMLNITNEFEVQFAEFQKVMGENQGKPSAASNFITQDLSKLAGLFNFMKNQATIRNDLYSAASDALTKVLEMSQGKRNLPEGKKFPDAFKEARDAAMKLIAAVENPWKQEFAKAVNSLVSAVNEKKSEQNGGQNQA